MVVDVEIAHSTNRLECSKHKNASYSSTVNLNLILIMHFDVLLPLIVSNILNIQLISCQGASYSCCENKYSHL